MECISESTQPFRNRILQTSFTNKINKALFALVFATLFGAPPFDVYSKANAAAPLRVSPHISRSTEAESLTAEYIPDPAITLTLTAKSHCEESTDDKKFTHKIRARWEMPDVRTGIKRVLLRALLSNGEVLEKEDAGLKGSVMFKIKRPLGSQVIVTATAETNAGNAVTNNTLVIKPCIEVPRPEHGIGFVAPTEDPDPGFTIPDSPIKESHFVHLGGTANPNKILMVSAAGTGAVVRLSSWTLDRDGSEFNAPLKPILLKDLEEKQIGHHAKLHTLSPESSPKLQAAPFVSGIIREGHLWLTTWQLNNAGDFLKIDTHGYGGAVNRTESVNVKEYAMAHRSINIGGTAYFELITPVITEDNTIRVLSWAIRKNDGTIFGLKDTGNQVANPAVDSIISISRIRNSDDVNYVTVYKNEDDVMTSVLLEVFNGNNLGASGFVFDRGNAASGLNLRGSNTVAESIDQAVAIPLNRGGYVTSTINGTDTLTSVWDYHMPGFDPVLVPHRVADESLDQDGGFGVDVGPVPNLTDGSSANVQNGATQKVRARLTDDLWEETFGVGAGEVASEFPIGEPNAVGIASVTKVMTLLLAVEAINNAQVDLDDPVTVSANAAGTGGSSMNLFEGEVQSLRNLMYGMMMVSGNDASVAIAEHITGGSESDFVDLMNFRATNLGLLATSYNQPAGGGYSTPQDQITLFRFGTKDPLFRDFVEKKIYTACGKKKNGDPICRNVDKFADNGYPGIEGWKNGNLGFTDSDFQGVPLCTSCLIGKARRADRAMLVGIQQSGARWTDTGNLWDYGFTKLFTPDKRASHTTIGSPVKDLAVDVINDNYAVTAVITNFNDLKLCLWNIWVDTGDLDNSFNECTTHPDFNLAGNNVTVTPNLVDGKRISTLLVEGDYITVTQGSGFSVKLWRVGPKEP